jgi:hypothetical protein
MFDMILNKRFEKYLRHNKMPRKEFAIEEGQSGREVTEAENFCYLSHQ